MPNAGKIISKGGKEFFGHGELKIALYLSRINWEITVC
jgi:hypothetical protein